MKRIRNILALVFALATVAGVQAFDSRAWLGKRQMLAQERDRLRAAYTNYAAQATLPAQGLACTLEAYPDGAVKTALFADLFQMFPQTDFIWVTDVMVVRLDSDGMTNAVLVADRGILDRTTKSGWIEGHAHLEHKRTSFDGDYVYFSSPEGYCSVETNTVLVSRDAKAEALR